jgi:4-hydroxybenzoate polyprenyltransferase
MTTLAMFGFAVNDIFDLRKDRAAGVRRPIASGTLSRSSAAWLAAGLLVTTTAFSMVAGSGGMILAITGAALFLYSPVALRYPLSKNPYVAVIGCAPLYYGAVAGYGHFPWISYAVLAGFLLGREAFMDADELPGDSRAGIRTFAALLGGRSTARIGVTLMLISAAALVVLARGPIMSVAALATLVSFACLFAWPGLNSGRQVELSRFPMLLGSIILACGGA